MAHHHTWNLFKRFRLALFSLASLIVLAVALVCVVLLVNSWRQYLTHQKAALSLILGVDVISCVALVLMSILQCPKPLVDLTRIGIILVFQLGIIVLFGISSPNLPCVEPGLVPSCKALGSVIIYSTAVVFALLVAFSVATLPMLRHPFQAPRSRSPSIWDTKETTDIITTNFTSRAEDAPGHYLDLPDKRRRTFYYRLRSRFSIYTEASTIPTHQPSATEDLRPFSDHGLAQISTSTVVYIATANTPPSDHAVGGVQMPSDHRVDNDAFSAPPRVYLAPPTDAKSRRRERPARSWDSSGSAILSAHADILGLVPDNVPPTPAASTCASSTYTKHHSMDRDMRNSVNGRSYEARTQPARVWPVKVPKLPLVKPLRVKRKVPHQLSLESITSQRETNFSSVPRSPSPDLTPYSPSAFPITPDSGVLPSHPTLPMHFTDTKVMSPYPRGSTLQYLNHFGR